MTEIGHEAVEAALHAHPARADSLLPVLHAVQAALGHIPDDAVPVIARYLGISRAEVHGVITFYHDFRRTPARGHRVQYCRAEACQARGGAANGAALCAEWGVDFGGESADGTLHLEAAFCLGLCGDGPAALIDGVPLAPATPDALRAALAGAAPAPVPSQLGAGRTAYVPHDSVAVAKGADAVAAALSAAGCTVIRTGSHGLFPLEPLVEMVEDGVRIAYGPVTAGDVPALIDGTHAARRGPIADHPWMRAQQRLTFARVGVIDPLSVADYRAHGGFAALDKARAMVPQAVVDAVKASGLRGRGGAGFPTGIKWQTVHDAPADSKYIVCNADEGDSATFADRMLIEGDPMTLIEGMAIAGHAVGAGHGIVYIRSEYPVAIRVLNAAIAAAAPVIAPFTLAVRVGAGAYVCGEETALLESIEGKRGQVRAKPPLPALHGLFGRPTVINNVLTLAAVPFILSEGAAAYAAAGFGRSRGTMPVQLAGNVKNAGLFEVGFGITLGALVHDIGGGTASGRPVKAVQVGGPLGAYIPPEQFDLPFDYEAFAEADALIGHGGITVFDDSVDMAAMARFAMEFCAVESCGKCTPCRIGSTRGVEVIDAMIAGDDRAGQAALLTDLCEVMRDGSLCALGGFTPYPVMSAMTHWPQDFGLSVEETAA